MTAVDSRKGSSVDDVLPATREHLETLNQFQNREDADVSRIQAAIEAISKIFGSSTYFVFVVVFIVAWILVNEWGARAGWQHVDEAPFFVLQGLVSGNALLLTVAVLIRQNRMSRQAARRAHLDLHINLLTEEKVSKVLQAVLEISKAAGKPVADEANLKELATAADPKAILAAIEETDALTNGRPDPTSDRPDS